jgi:small-conductance mechanosensitive channel
MLLMAAERTPGLLPDHKPFVLQRELGDYAVTYELNVYSDAPTRMMATYHVLHRAVLDVFNEYGVQIMTPSYVADPARAKVVAKQDWSMAPAAPEGPGLPPAAKPGP